ncbi:hypothetical protein SAMN04489711_12716 [Paracidovorax wautersii]|uniref:Uncharacterized protein n=2 Tax=Paracidovorax wautersii TaxID=1177982 RepID=A0A1I2HQ35_9BURK|nr:hypothetical protein SAMN04489711_12716 [Paracidovorax wautersii]
MALDQEVSAQASAVTREIVHAPMAKETEHAVSQLRTCAQFGQELQALDDKLASLYLNMQSVITQSDVMPHQRQSRATARLSMGSSAATAVEDVAPRAAGQSAPGVVKLPRNATILLTWLRSSLDQHQWTNLTHQSMAHGSGLPPGSISSALGTLIKHGLVTEGERGYYRLA